MTDLPPDDQSPDEVRRGFVRDWLMVAALDMQYAEIILAGTPDTYTGVAMHCQQAVEKLIKAVLVYHQIGVPRSHDIAMLLSLLLGAEPEFVQRNSDARVLTQFAVAPRYPDGFAPMELAAARALYGLTQRVQSDVLDLLAPFLEEE